MKNGCVHLLDVFHINLTMTKYKDIAKVINFERSCQSLFLQQIKNQSVKERKCKMEKFHKEKICLGKNVYYLFFPKKIGQYKYSYGNKSIYLL